MISMENRISAAFHYWLLRVSQYATSQIAELGSLPTADFTEVSRIMERLRWQNDFLSALFSETMSDMCSVMIEESTSEQKEDSSMESLGFPRALGLTQKCSICEGWYNTPACPEAECRFVRLDS